MTDESLRELGKQLPHDRPDLDRRESVRASLLAAATVPQQPNARRWLLAGGGFAAGALAAAAIAIILIRPRAESVTTPAAHEAYARIESSSAAELEHTMVPTSTGTDELVRLHAGKIRLAVPPTRTGDRVRVTTGDAEIEGSGAYEVIVTADALASVTVTAGTATIKLAGASRPVFLAAGQTWRAQVQTADLPLAAAQVAITTPDVAPTTRDGSPIETTLDPRPTAPAPSPPSPAPRVKTPRAITPQGSPIETELAPEPPRAAVTAPTPELTTGEPARPATPTPTPGSEIERHFRAGSALLRANKLADAITELGAAADAGDGPLAADARYYQAVALVKAKRGPEAERALVQFLDRAPTSVRRGRAAMMLGRLLADRGDATAAKAWFELAGRDPDPAVAAAAKAAM